MRAARGRRKGGGASRRDLGEEEAGDHGQAHLHEGRDGQRGVGAQRLAGQHDLLGILSRVDAAAARAIEGFTVQGALESELSKQPARP